MVCSDGRPCMGNWWFGGEEPQIEEQIGPHELALTHWFHGVQCHAAYTSPLNKFANIPFLLKVLIKKRKNRVRWDCKAFHFADESSSEVILLWK
jgi:hypothetical protein